MEWGRRQRQTGTLAALQYATSRRRWLNGLTSSWFSAGRWVVPGWFNSSARWCSP